MLSLKLQQPAIGSVVTPKARYGPN